MKFSIIIIFLLSCTFTLFAQEGNDPKKILLNVAWPDSLGEITVKEYVRPHVKLKDRSKKAGFKRYESWRWKMMNQYYDSNDNLLLEVKYYGYELCFSMREILKSTRYNNKGRIIEKYKTHR